MDLALVCSRRWEQLNVVPEPEFYHSIWAMSSGFPPVCKLRSWLWPGRTNGPSSGSPSVVRADRFRGRRVPPPAPLRRASHRRSPRRLGPSVAAARPRSPSPSRTHPSRWTAFPTFALICAGSGSPRARCSPSWSSAPCSFAKNPRKNRARIRVMSRFGLGSSLPCHNQQEDPSCSSPDRVANPCR
jgi:hypothetical protein